MKLRKMNEKDLKNVVSLLLKQYSERNVKEVEEHTAWHLQNVKEYCFIVEDKGEIKGVLILHPHESIKAVEEEYKDILELEDIYAVSRGSKKLLLSKLQEVSKDFEYLLLETDLLRELLS